MLDKFRKGSVNVVAKVLIGLLIISFAFWGVGDMIRSYGVDTAIEIGDQKVSAAEYSRRFNRQLFELSRRFGTNLTAEQGRAFGLDRTVMQQILLDHHAGNLNLGVSDDAIAEALHDLPGLKKPDGSFDASQFQSVLRENGFTEASFVAYSRESTIRNQIVNTLAAAVPAPKVVVDAANRFENEERVLSYIVIGADKLAAAAAPSDTKLKEYYDAHLKDFEAPEYRTVGMLQASPDSQKDAIALTDSELRAEYEARKSDFGSAETRKLQQISFKDKAAADAAFKELSGGKDFLEVAKAAGFTEKDVDLGVVSKNAMLDNKVADAAFATEKGKFSAPIEGALSTSIVRVLEATPASVKSFDEVKAGIKDRLQRDRFMKSLPDIHAKVEDERAKGRTLTEIGKDMKLVYRDVGPFDRAGKDMAGKGIEGVDGLASVLKVAFETEVGVEIDSLDLGDKGEAWVEVKTITAVRQKPFEEVKADVGKAFAAEERSSGLAKLAKELADRAGKGEALDVIAKGVGAEVKKSAPLKRAAKDEQVSGALLAMAFSLPKGATSAAPGADGSSRVVFRVDEIVAPKPYEAERAKAVAGELGGAMASEMVDQYVGTLKMRYGLAVNEATMKRIAGIVDEQQQ